MSLAISHFYSMFKNIYNSVSVFCCSFFAPWKVNDNRPASLHAHSTRQSCIRCNFHTVGPHCFGNPANVSIANLLCSLGRKVLKRHTRTTTSYYNIAFKFIGVFYDGIGNLVDIVLDNLMLNACSAIFYYRIF